MQSTSADVLEFEALREVLSRYVSSPLGREELARIAPSSDRAALERALAHTAEAVDYLRAAALSEFLITEGTLPVIENAFSRRGEN